MPKLKTMKPLFLTIFTLLAILFPTAVLSQEDTVTSIEFEDSSEIHLFIAENTYQLKVLAYVNGSDSGKDVTNEAYWVSSSPQTIKVDKGLLTPLKQGTAKITAKYKNLSISIDANASYLFKELLLSETEKVNYELGDISVEIRAFAVEEDGSWNDVTEQATWSSSKEQIVTVSKGKLTLNQKGKTVITAKFKGLSSSVDVEVTSPYKEITIDSHTNLEMMVGADNVLLQAIATLVNDMQENVTDKATWKSSNANVVSVEQGKLTPLAAGTSKIVVDYLGVSTDITVIVRLPYQAMVLTPGDDLDLFLNDSPVQIKAQVLNDPASTQNVTQEATWTSSNPYVATVQNGYIVPKAVGAATITVAYRGLSKTIKVTVFQNISSFKLEEQTMELFKGEVAKLPAVIGTMINEQKYDFSTMVEWFSSDETIAVVENGKLTAKKPGKALITAKIRNFTDTLTVHVQEKVLVLLPSERAFSLVVGSEAQLPVVKAVFEDGQKKDVTKDIVWTASAPNLLVKDNMIKGLLGAKVQLKGTYLNRTILIPVTIEDEIVQFIVEPNQIELNPGKSKSIRVTGIYADDKKVNLSSKLTWVSTDPTIAEVKGSSVRAIKEGSVRLIATYQGKNIEALVHVVPKLVRLETGEKSYKLSVHDRKKLTITAVYDSGKAVDVTSEAVWTSSNLNVVTVDKGEIKALKPGTATIKATFNKKTVSIRITVK